MSSQKTTNYNLNKWNGEDRVLRTEFNENFDKIDTQLKTNADTDTAQNTRLTDLENRATNVENNKTDKTTTTALTTRVASLESNPTRQPYPFRDLAWVSDEKNTGYSLSMGNATGLSGVMNNMLDHLPATSYTFKANSSTNPYFSLIYQNTTPPATYKYFMIDRVVVEQAGPVFYNIVLKTSGNTDVVIPGAAKVDYALPTPLRSNSIWVQFVAPQDSEITVSNLQIWGTDSHMTEYDANKTFAKLSDAGKVGSRPVDETNMADGKIIRYNSSTGKFEYVDANAHTHTLAISDITNLQTTLDGKQKKITISTTAPTNPAPIQDDFWLDVSALPYKLKRHSGVAWGDVGIKTASELPIVDAGGLITATNVETALQELASAKGLAGTKAVDETNIANGKVLQYNSTSGKLEYATPAVSNTPQYFQVAFTGPAQTVNQTIKTIEFYTKTDDPLNLFSTTTHKFTPTVAGTYEFTLRLQLTPGAVGNDVKIVANYGNGTVYETAWLDTPNSTTPRYITVSAIKNFTVGEAFWWTIQLPTAGTATYISAKTWGKKIS